MNPHPLANAISAFISSEKQIADLPWNQHPVFAGVALKHLITGQETNGQMSQHLVRIEPNCAIGNHTHATQWELHQVLAGAGETAMRNKTIPYAIGTISTIPLGEEHEVRASGEGMMLLATFSPPLV
ncbi:MAG: hypothetical protein H6R04_2061 [Burkholderiaceae bacterium]|nr:hypothetical protein [Burkholderiaceae bacterium]